MSDLVLRNTQLGDIAIEDGMTAAVGPELPGGKRDYDASGLTALPGVIDVHVHFNEPGRTEWEGAHTGSRAFAAGGGTLFFDMPLNSSPCTVTGEAFDEKLAALEAVSLTDFALWGGIIPGNREAIPELADRGVVGFKAFLSDSGLPEFPRADDLTLYEGMREAARCHLPVSVHAESEEIIRSLSRRMLEAGRRDIRAFLESRPVIAEVEAIHRAGLIARETGCRLHIVHVSSGRGVAAALEARALGADISIETCPHYLFFTEDDLERIGALAKCAPPLRSAAEQEALWHHVLTGSVDIIGSDHSPCSPELKQRDDFFAIWGGIAGVQSTLAVLLEEGHAKRGMSLASISDKLSAWPAERFRISKRGRLEPGYAADIVLIDLSKSQTLQADHLRQRHATSPYIGHTFLGTIRETILRGRFILQEEGARGKFVRPERN